MKSLVKKLVKLKKGVGHNYLHFSRFFFLWARRPWERYVHIPILSLSAIHFKVIVVYCRRRRAIFSFSGSLFAPSAQGGFTPTALAQLGQHQFSAWAASASRNSGR